MNQDVEKIVRRGAYGRRAAAATAAANPGDAATQHMAATVFVLAGAHELAVQHFKRAAMLAPANAEYAHALGAAQLTLGEIEAAAQSFARAIALAPDMAKAYYALVQLKPDAALAAPLERLVEDRDPTGVTPLFAGHALAILSERAGDYAGSMAWLAKAKARRGALRPYRVKAERDTAEAAISAGPMQGAGYATAEPIFIVGLPRTGTSLIDRILSSHSDVSSAGELSNFAQIVKAMAKTPSALSLDPPTLQAASRLQAQEVGRAYLESTRPLTGAAPRFIDKAPINYLAARHIHSALPDARIVCVLRDPLDTCLSLYRQVFPTEHPYYDYVYRLETTARAYVQFTRVAQHWRATLPPERYLEVRYEDVVEDLPGQARRLIAFCGLEWQDRVLDFHQNKSGIATPSAAQVRQPLYRTSVGRWRHYGALLDPARRVLREAGLSDVLPREP